MADTDLFARVASDDELHPSFKALVSSRSHEPARDMLQRVWGAFPNPDPHFIREFQTAHFDARIWELYIFAVGYFEGFTVTQPHSSPDFLFEREGFDGIWLEAVTANPSETRPATEPAPTIDDGRNHMRDIVPIRLGSPLYSKLKRKYWDLPHVAGKPFVIAIGDYSDDSPLRWSDAPLIRYLYGSDGRVVSSPGEVVEIEYTAVDKHVDGVKEIPSGFFNLSDAKNVSAVMFSNEGTIPKFKRMGFDPSRYPSLRMIRVGQRVDFDPRATLPKAFGYLVGDAPEEWCHGAYVYHNPNATHPLPLEFFRKLGGQHWVANGRPRNELREFSPFSSITISFNEGRLSDDQLRAHALEMAGELDEQMHRDAGLLAWRDLFIK